MYKSAAGIFVGWDADTKGCKAYDRGSFIVSRNSIFNENISPSTVPIEADSSILSGGYSSGVDILFMKPMVYDQNSILLVALHIALALIKQVIFMTDSNRGKISLNSFFSLVFTTFCHPLFYHL